MTDDRGPFKPSDIAGRRVRDTRTRRGWIARELAARCAALGAPELTASVIANIESGRRDKSGNRRRDVTIDELLALASVLEVPPVSLVEPEKGEQLQITDDVVMGPAVALAFFSGRAPAPDASARASWVDIAYRAMQYQVARLDDAELSGTPEETRMRLIEIVDDAFREVRAAVPPGRNGGAVKARPVVAAIVTSGKGVLVGRRNDGNPPWTFIAGEIEPGERPEDAAIREVKEETGCEVRAGRVIGERDHPATGRHLIYMAAKPAGRSTRIAVGDEAELAEVRWVGLAEADELLPGMFEPVRAYLAAELRSRP